MTLYLIVAWCAVAVTIVAVAFVRGAHAKPSQPERPDPLIRVYSEHGCEVWVRSVRHRGGAVKVGTE